MDEAVRQLIVDTDPGIDDAMALLFLQAMPRTRIAAITSVFGNAAVDVTTRNARYLAERFGIDAPVHAGAAQPLRIPRRPSPVHVHGGDGGRSGGTEFVESLSPARHLTASIKMAAVLRRLVLISDFI